MFAQWEKKREDRIFLRVLKFYKMRMSLKFKELKWRRKSWSLKRRILRALRRKTLLLIGLLSCLQSFAIPLANQLFHSHPTPCTVPPPHNCHPLPPVWTVLLCSLLLFCYPSGLPTSLTFPDPLSPQWLLLVTHKTVKDTSVVNFEILLGSMH